MAEEKTPANSAKVEGEKEAFQVDPGMMSLEELDSIIAKEDPEALQNIEGVRSVAAEQGAIIEILEYDESAEEKKKLKHKIKKLKGKTLILWIWAKNRSIENAKKFGVWTVETAKHGKENLGNAAKTFKEWSIAQKLLFVSAILISAGAGTFAYMAFVKKSFSHKEEMFLTSLLSLSENTITLSGDAAMETFYNSSRIPKNIFSLKRMVVNIQPSESSGANPMVAYEFSLEGNSTEVLIEIKDREGEIIDQVQRTIEDHTFDELNSVEGKKMIADKVRSTVNRLLTLGKIRYVYIQGVIFKP